MILERSICHLMTCLYCHTSLSVRSSIHCNFLFTRRTWWWYVKACYQDVRRGFSIWIGVSFLDRVDSCMFFAIVGSDRSPRSKSQYYVELRQGFCNFISAPSCTWTEKVLAKCKKKIGQIFDFAKDQITRSASWRLRMWLRRSIYLRVVRILGINGPSDRRSSCRLFTDYVIVREMIQRRTYVLLPRINDTDRMYRYASSVIFVRDVFGHDGDLSFSWILMSGSTKIWWLTEILRFLTIKDVSLPLIDISTRWIYSLIRSRIFWQQKCHDLENKSWDFCESCNVDVECKKISYFAKNAYWWIRRQSRTWDESPWSLQITEMELQERIIG